MEGLDLRDGVTGLVTYAERDLNALWRQVRTAAEAETALRDVLPALIDTYGLAAGALAADWYDNLRDKVGVGGAFRAIPADIQDTGAQALVGWAVTTAVDESSLQSLILGGTQRRVANFSRFTVQLSSKEDPKASGWVRVGEGNCKSGWCDQYLDGEVRTVAYDFPAHDHCLCHAAPAF